MEVARDLARLSAPVSVMSSLVPLVLETGARAARWLPRPAEMRVADVARMTACVMERRRVTMGN
jgi:hypothetical protein